MTDTAPPVPVPAAAPPARGPGGLFAPGNRIGAAGRAPRPALIDLAHSEAVRAGIDLHAALGRVALKMVALAEAGDVQAARLVVDRLTLAPDDLDLLGVVASDTLTDDERGRRVASLLAVAALRRRGGSGD